MKLVTNSVAPNQVHETDEKYVIENVPFIRAQNLSGGYVPEANIEATAPKWENVPATLNHPRNDKGQPVPAETKPETHIGTIVNPHWDGETVRANIHLPKKNLQSADAKQIKEALENGEHISVSSQYAAEPAPSGEYDGEMRENVERITRPDSVAILPNQQGKCSVADGCGINPEMVANADVTIPMQANAKHFESGDLVEWTTGDATAQGRVVEVLDVNSESLSKGASTPRGFV